MSNRDTLLAYGVVADLIGEELASYSAVERASAKALKLEKIQNDFANAATQLSVTLSAKNGVHT